MKILHYIPTYAPAWAFGGPVLSVSRTCEALAALGHTVEVFTTMAGVPTTACVVPNGTVQRAGVAVTYFEQERGFGIHSPGMEAAVRARASEFDLIHVTGVWQRTSVAACRAAATVDVPYVVSPRGALGPYSWRHKTLKKAAYYALRERRNVHRAAAIHYTTAQEQRECEWLRLPGRSFVVPNPIDFAQLAPDRHGAAEWLAAQGLNPSVPLLLNVGRQHHKKGLELLPAALRMLRDEPWQAVFVGGDDDGTGRALQRTFAELGLTARVRWLPRLEPNRLAAVYSAADVFLLPSRHENFGNVVVEALSCGCPVVVSPEVGLSAEIERARVGAVVARRPRLWADAIQRAFRNPDVVREDGIRGREWAVRTFAAPRVASEMARHYEETVRCHRRRTP